VRYLGPRETPQLVKLQHDGVSSTKDKPSTIFERVVLERCSFLGPLGSLTQSMVVQRNEWQRFPSHSDATAASTVQLAAASSAVHVCGDDSGVCGKCRRRRLE